MVGEKERARFLYIFVAAYGGEGEPPFEGLGEAAEATIGVD
jgi:hypothetical protein